MGDRAADTTNTGPMLQKPPPLLGFVCALTLVLTVSGCAGRSSDALRQAAADETRDEQAVEMCTSASPDDELVAAIDSTAGEVRAIADTVTESGTYDGGLSAPDDEYTALCIFRQADTENFDFAAGWVNRDRKGFITFWN